MGPALVSPGANDADELEDAADAADDADADDDVDEVEPNEFMPLMMPDAAPANVLLLDTSI